MTSAALALVLAAAGLGVRTQLPPPPVQLYRIAWQRPFVGARTGELHPAERGGVAVDPVTKLAIFGTRDGWLHAVRPDATVAWELQGGAGFGPPTIDGDTVYAGSSDGKLYAVAIPTGKARWSYDSKEDVSTRPAVAGGLVYVSSLEDTVFAVDAATGAWKWHHRRERKGSGLTIFGAAPALAAGGSVYGAYSDGFVAALDGKTGQARWERLVAPKGDHLDVDGLALEGGRLFAAAYSGAVLALDAATGQTLWSSPAPGASRVVATGGFVVAVTPANVYALSPADGARIWGAPLGGSPEGTPAFAGKWLVVPAGGGGLRWLETASGRLLREFDPGTGVSGTPGVAGGRIYVLSNGGDLFALDLVS